ncbi:hypothetical protein NMG60_11022435 [Bertholletia excelsa]
MGENPKLENMNSGELSSSWDDCESGKFGSQKISVSDQPNTVQFTNNKSDSFIVDMERLSHLTDKDTTANSRITLQRNFSRKLSLQRGGEKKMNPNTVNEKDNVAAATSSPRAGASMPEKPMVVTVGTTDRPTNAQVHHQITIMTGKLGATAGETCAVSRRRSFKRSAPSWALDPRRILIFFATLSSMGTILLIYFTLAMARPSGDDSAQDW